MGTHPIFESDFDCLTVRMGLSVEVEDARSGKIIANVDRLQSHATIADVKARIAEKHSKYYVERQSLRLEAKGKALKDNEQLQNLGIDGKLYFKDLGPQIGWGTVFVAEYAGPLFIYLLFYLRPEIVYGAGAVDKPMEPVVKYAAACHSFHYAKRILETIFVHRFSNSTMPIRNLFKNCTYYWGFAAFMAYFINHPLYTAPCVQQTKFALIAFLICEFGNFSIHILLKNLRPPGTRDRKIPMPDANPMSLLYNFVSCPNYTYEVGAWLSFGIMTQCLPVMIFMLCGFGQMTVWAQGKHRRYKSEFKAYPRRRTAIIPYIL